MIDIEAVTDPAEIDDDGPVEEPADGSFKSFLGAMDEEQCAGRKQQVKQRRGPVEIQDDDEGCRYGDEEGRGYLWVLEPWKLFFRKRKIGEQRAHPKRVELREREKIVESMWVDVDEISLPQGARRDDADEQLGQMPPFEEEDQNHSQE